MMGSTLLKKYFELNNDQEIKRDILAGITTFLSSAYIIIVNPMILSHAGLHFSAIVTATVITASVCTILMGVYAKNPILIAPGMGLNAFFTYNVVMGMKVSPEIALGTVFWSGLIFLLLSFTNFRESIVKCIPQNIKYATACGIGLFITFIGLQNAGVIIHHPATLVTIAPLTFETATFFLGLMITGFLLIKEIKGALLFGIIITTILSLPLGYFWGHKVIISYHAALSMPDFSLVGALNLSDSLHIALFPAIFSFFFTDLFDSLSTFVGVAEASDLKESNGEFRNLKKSLIVDAFATWFASIMGSSSGTAYIESATGIREGGKSGLVALTAGLLFLPFLFFSPLLSCIPQLATATGLVWVGLFMISPITKIKWNDLDQAIPAFLTLIFIPLGFSISKGIMWGFISHSFIQIARGKGSDVPVLVYVIDVLGIISLAAH